MTIEDIILDRDRRGISKLRQYLPADFCEQAAGFILEHPGKALITTGFYILAAGKPETDGPPGAVAIGNALEALGYEVVYVTDKHTFGLMEAIKSERSRVVEFEITDDDTSKRIASEMLADLDPSILIAIERCGWTDEGLYRNMLGRDISEFNARLDHLFTSFPHTVGIGDGGNEIGLGNLAKEITTVDTLVKEPCVVSVSRLILASVSNWGGYGLAASLSMLSSKNVLLSVEEDMELIKRSVDWGAVDGITTEQVYKVDGFTLDENAETLTALHELLEGAGTP